MEENIKMKVTKIIILLCVFLIFSAYLDAGHFIKRLCTFKGDTSSNSSSIELFDQAEKYAIGREVEQNYEKAARLYQQSAEKGYAPAKMKLGCCYYEGHGIAQDYV